MAGKAKIVVSDLHLGAGFAQAGNALEDFTKDEDFARFLGGIKRESEAEGREFELIIAGDMLEFLQVPAADAFDPRRRYPPQAYRPSSEDDSLRKLELIIAGHPTFFAALRDFLAPAHPRRAVTIVKGNHDVNLHWGAVQDRLREALGATGERAGLLTFEERCVSREGIYVEHGNQYAERFNRFVNFEEPHDPVHEGQLVLVPGSRFVIDFFNQVERERYWVDGVKPLTALIWYAFAFDFPFAVRALASFLRVAPLVLLSSLALGRAPHPSEDPTGAEPQREIRGRVTARTPAMALARREVARAHSALYRAAEARSREEGARVVVFGHTHRALSLPLRNGGLYLNAGTWVWVRDFSAEDEATWRELFAHPERFTEDRRLTYVRIDYDREGQPWGRLLDFR